jgi:tRNA pseudouridine55 synthase
MDAALVIDKPEGMTSHDVVNRVRRILKERSIGHLGTLDPMATGILPLLVGRYTRLAQFFERADKSYEGEIQLGFSTDTYDATGERTSEAKAMEVSVDQVRKAAKQFIGKIEQLPPPFSAKKIAGVPAYKLARKGKAPELKAVPVEVKAFEIVEVTGDRVRFRAEVSAGTYVRTLAHELGQALGLGGHLAALRRTAAGQFGLESAVELAELENIDLVLRDAQCPITDIMSTTTGKPLFLHPRTLLRQIPAVSANDEMLHKISHGTALNLPDYSENRYVKVFRGQTEIVAICTRVAGTLFQPSVVLIPSPAPAPLNSGGRK